MTTILLVQVALLHNIAVISLSIVHLLRAMLQALLKLPIIFFFVVVANSIVKSIAIFVTGSTYSKI